MTTQNLHIIYLYLLKIAAEVAQPLQKIDEVVIIGEDKTSLEVSKLISSLPPAVQALTGKNISQVRVYLLHSSTCVLTTLKYVCTYYTLVRTYLYTQVRVYLIYSSTYLVPWIFTYLRLLACRFLSLDRL